ncbi:MAG: T9SS type A sorting domain-containing protein [Ferruginibacter sp.]|nr:T9SS type A sorting domain-containing protein [Ferruginibacter sp.]
MKKIYVLFFLIFACAGVWAQVSLTNGSPSATIDFSNSMQTGVGSNPATAFAGAGFEPATVTAGRLNSNAWAVTGMSDGALAFGGTNTTGDHARGSTAVAITTGGIYAYTGAPGSVANPALMIQPGAADFTPGTLTLRIQNDGTTNITQLAVSYNLFIRNDQAWSNSFNFSYSSDNVSYTTVPALDYASPAAADALGWIIVGSAPSRTTTITGLSIAPGSYVYIRWSGDDVSGSGSRDEFGLDDINLTATFSAGGTPDIVLSSPNPSVAAGNMAQGSTNNLIYRFDLAVTTADATLNGVTINTAGTYTVADITNFKCWYSSDAVFSPGTDVLLSTLTPVGTAGPQVFPSFPNQTVLNGATGYFFISADLPCTAVPGNNISVNAITTADISFVSGNKTGTAFAGGLQTIIAATPNDVTAPAASVANASSSLSWVTPTGCFDEILIVARATTNNDGTPTGDGTAYTGNAAYGSGTPLGSGFVVYKGPSTSPQPVTGLINGTAYYYKFFTRLGTTWSTGIEVNATPALVTLATDYFRSIASGSWAVATTWESSADSSTWIPATLIPGALAAHVVIQNPDSVYLAANTITANLTVMSGAVANALTFTMTATNRFNLLGTASFYQGGTSTFVPGIQQVLAATSNYHYNGVQNGLNSGAYPEFGNFIWEPTPTISGTFQNNVVLAPANLGLLVRGNMTINIQGGTPREVRFATGTSITRTHVIDGNLNIISSSSVVVISNGGLPVQSTLTVGGNINISAGILQGTSSSAATNGNAVLNLRGNINNTGGTIQTGASTAGIFSLNYTGTAAQSINNTGGTFIFTANQLDSINKAGGALTLNTPVTHNGTIYFLSGIVNTTTVNLLTLGATSAVLNASNASYVSGPVKKTGNTTFIFPVGKVNGYVPLGVSNFTGLSAPTDELTAEYIRASGNALGPITDPFLNRVSSCEYWTLDVNAGTPTVDLTLYWNANNACNGAYITNVADIEIAHFDGTNWNSSSTGFSSKTGTPAAGDVTWAGVSTFSPFTIASVSNANPLPITINYFNGTRNNGNHLLNWKVTCVSTPNATIELERSTDARNYSSIYSIFATALRCQQPFDYIDAQPAKGINYYRLKMTDANGKITYSTVVPLINAVKGIDVMNIAPNPIVNGSFNLKVSSAEKAQIELVITDVQGRILQKQPVNVIAGFNLIPMNVRNLAAGTYQLFGNTAGERTRVLRFVVQ